MAKIKLFEQQPTEILDYDFDFTGWLGADTITGATASCTPTGLTLTVSHSTKVAKVWATDGAVGKTYRVEVQITTTAGRAKERFFDLRIFNV